MKLKELLSADTDVVAGVIITVDNKILLCLRSKDGSWSVPKGHVQVNETPVQGALRELSEETDIQLHQDELELVDFGMRTKSDGTPGMTYLYKHDGAGQYVPKLNLEHEAWGYFTVGNYPEPLDKILQGVI
jgi:8-oxo-dGTP pyrophosphatase MutT (NUDIX family)|tara:strand:+ start:283 stop:675 length:393 start_codon:yes stop_codon:yes gene_type:complete